MAALLDVRRVDMSEEQLRAVFEERGFPVLVLRFFQSVYAHALCTAHQCVYIYTLAYNMHSRVTYATMQLGS